MPHNETYALPAGPPPNRRAQEYAPPPGPPPSHQSQQYAAPSGPPPNYNSYDPPPGPPPGHSQYAPPPGPPPSQTTPFHDWQTAVPDTSLLPPPPSLGNQRSSTNNATEWESEQGEAWCRENPLTPPVQFPAEALAAIAKGEIGVIKPRPYVGDLTRPRPGVWLGKTKSRSPDSCICSTVPLYSARAHSPLQTGGGTPRTIYYEVRLASSNKREISLALGFSAPPYPSFRLPGWHRGSLAVHGDDGCRYVNDLWGGKDFTAPFKPGQTIGIGMTFSARDSTTTNITTASSGGGRAPQTTATTPINVEIFLTRDGKRDGGWNLHEEGDAVEDRPVTGLEGFHDLFATVGTFENVEFDIVFSRAEWMYRPRGEGGVA